MSKTPEPVVWLSLVDVSGPFLAGTVLQDAFPQGLEKIETPRRQRLRSAYDEWVDAVDEDDPCLLELHEAWVRMILCDGLEYDDEVLATQKGLSGGIMYRSSEHGVQFSPDFVVQGGDGAPKLLVSIHPPGTNLEKPLPDEKWPASPAERMTLLCRASDCRIGLITNGEQWMLVNAPVGETSGYASWYARLWWQEPVTFKAFQSLLGVRRCFGPEEDTLPRLLERSLDFQEEVTNTLGEQVRRAVEVLIQSLGRADQDRNGELLKDVEPADLYEAGLTVMMRLVFILCAEERGLLLLGDPVYDQHYAVSTLRAKLREDADQYGIEVSERRHDAWSRLLSVFRIIYGGVEHEALRMPALGGSLFDPDRFPFLEGRPRDTKWRETPAVPLPIDNRTVLLLMTALQVLEQRDGAQLLSYRALDVEQIGHVYEGLLEFTAARVPEMTLGLIGTKKLPNPQITLTELESFSGKGEKPLVEHLKERTGRSLSALRKAVAGAPDTGRLPKLVLACHGDEQVARRLLLFAELIRSDSWENLLVYPEGSFAIVKGMDRRSSGTHYTPRSLTEPIVRYTLEPLVYVGPAEGHPQEGWKLKSSADILALNVCDMACGSGAFLVEACRYLSQRLVEAWMTEETRGLHIGIDGIARQSPSEHELLPKNLDDRLLVARRLVAQSCLYGVDINHLAVELAKLSIWLVTLAKNKPFSFLDHALRCGDSLVGLHDLEQLRFFSLKPAAKNPVLFKGPLNTAVDKAIDLRLQLEGMPANTVSDIERQERILSEAEYKVAQLKCAADLLVSAELWSENNADKLERVQQAAKKSAYYIDKGQTEELKQVASKERRGQKMFHWPLEFPEVIVKLGGFHAFVGNPPFMGGQKISGYFGSEYREYLVEALADSKKGSADLCAFFLLRATTLLNGSGFSGLLATKTIAEGDTREVGLEQVTDRGVIIYRTYPSLRWPGIASVLVAVVWMSRKKWNGQSYIDDTPVTNIGANLSEILTIDSTVDPLAANANQCFIGSYLQGTGFYLNAEVAERLLQIDPSYKEIVRPLIRGEDVNRLPTMDPKIYAIHFGERSLEECREFPDALRIVEQEVRPERNKSKDEKLKKYWWRYKRTTMHLYDLNLKLQRVLVQSFTSKYVAFRFVASHSIFAAPIVVVISDSIDVFAVLSSSVHSSWVVFRGSSMGTTLRYTPSDCFETFPFPNSRSTLLTSIGGDYESHRNLVMKANQIGITSTLNLFHDEKTVSAEIEKLRQLHVELDYAVASAYGWTDLELGHGFRETKEGIRFTVSEQARREILQRLLKLNHERYEEEVRQGLHSKKSKKKLATVRKPAVTPQLALIENSREQDTTTTGGDTWYFAYGNNMSRGRKEERTGLIHSARKARLKGFRLAFNKNDGAGGVYANILPASGETVWGVVYLCDVDAMAELDQREAVRAGHYERRAVTVLLDSGEEIEAITYVAGERFIVEEGTPSDDYLAFIVEGAAEHSLPTEYVDKIRKLAQKSKGIR